MVKREYLKEANKGNWDLEKMWKRCMATKDKDGPTVPFVLDPVYSKNFIRYRKRCLEGYLKKYFPDVLERKRGGER